MKKKRLLFIWIAGSLLFLIGSLPRPGYGQASVVLKADEQFQFADHYFKKGDYTKAVSEYERFVYFFPEDARVPQAMYQVGESYFRGHQFDDAVRAFQGVLAKYPQTELARKAYFQSSACYVRQKKYGDALNILDKLLWTNPTLDIKDEAYYRKGWIYLETDNWEKAWSAFDQISAQNRETYGLQDLLEDMDKRSLMKQKRPGAAGVLAVLPGAGHLYVGRYRDALISFTLNGLMIFAAWEAFDNGNEALGVLLSVVEVGFYSANIYSAVNAAHKYNRKQKNAYFQYLKKHTTLEASAVRWNEKPALALTCNIRF